VSAQLFTVEALLELFPDDSCLLAHHKVLPGILYKIETLQGDEILFHNSCLFYLEFAPLGQVGFRVFTIVHVCFVLVILFLPLGIALFLLQVISLSQMTCALHFLKISATQVINIFQLNLLFVLCFVSTALKWRRFRLWRFLQTHARLISEQ